MAAACDRDDDNPEKIIRSAIVTLNSMYPWDTNGALNCYDIETNTLHELGHLLGIAHCHEGNNTCSSTTCISNVMNPNSAKGKINTTLKGYDTASYQVIYMYD